MQVMNADEIKELRRRANMTQEEFAYAIGTNARTISRWETGRVIPRRLAKNALLRFARKLERKSPSPLTSSAHTL